MHLDLPEFHLFSTSTSFIEELDATALKYQATSILAALATCLRGPAFKWLKEQPEFSSLTSFKTALAAAFPPPQESPDTSPSSETAPHPPPVYHSCPECNAQFSSISRLLQHTQKNCFNLACKHCEESFNSNNKLHEHVRLRHSQKSSTKSIASSSTHSVPAAPPAAPPNTPLGPPAPLTTPRKYIVETLRHRLEKKGGKHVNLPLTPPPTPSHTPVLQLRKRSAKPYMTIDDLYAMFAVKQQKPSPDDIQISAPSPPFRQARITSYFKPVISSATQSISRPPTPSASQSARALPNQKQGTPQMTGDLSSLKTQRKHKVPKFKPPTSVKASSGQQYMATADTSHTALGIRVETTLTQARGYEPAKSPFFEPLTTRLSSAPRTCPPANHKQRLTQTSGSSSPTCSTATKLKAFKSELPASTYASVSPARIPALCHNLYSSMPSRADLLCALIHLTLQPATIALIDLLLRLYLSVFP